MANAVKNQTVKEGKGGDKNFVVLNEKIYDIINSFTLSSNALKALIAQNLNQKSAFQKIGRQSKNKTRYKNNRLRFNRCNQCQTCFR